MSTGRRSQVDNAQRLKRLQALLPVELEALIFLVDAPHAALPPASAPQTQRAIELLRWADASPERAARIDAVLDDATADAVGPVGWRRSSRAALIVFAGLLLAGGVHLGWPDTRALPTGFIGVRAGAPFDVGDIVFAADGSVLLGRERCFPGARIERQPVSGPGCGGGPELQIHALEIGSSIEPDVCLEALNRQITGMAAMPVDDGLATHPLEAFLVISAVVREVSSTGVPGAVLGYQCRGLSIRRASGVIENPRGSEDCGGIGNTGR